MVACSRCQKENDRKGQRYCKACHAKYMREHRVGYASMTDLAKKKSSARAYANTYKKRGKLSPLPCFVCEDLDVEMHHEDYDKPLDVLWLCRACHLSCHNFSREKDPPWEQVERTAQPRGQGNGEQGRSTTPRR